MKRRDEVVKIVSVNETFMSSLTDQKCCYCRTSGHFAVKVLSFLPIQVLVIVKCMKKEKEERKRKNRKRNV